MIPWYGWMVIIIAFIIAHVQARKAKRKKERDLYEAGLRSFLSGKQYGIVISDPNGNSTWVESLLTGGLSEYGAVCVQIKREMLAAVYAGRVQLEADSECEGIIVGTFSEVSFEGQEILPTQDFELWAAKHYPHAFTEGAFSDSQFSLKYPYEKNPYETYEQARQKLAKEYATYHIWAMTLDYRILNRGGAVYGNILRYRYRYDTDRLRWIHGMVAQIIDDLPRVPTEAKPVRLLETTLLRLVYDHEHQENSETPDST